MKAYAVVFTPRVERQLIELYAYIADGSGETRAEAYVGGLVDACRALSTFPVRGTPRDDVRPNLRTIGYARRVTIAFSVHEPSETVTIHGAFYGGQNFESLLRQSDSDE